LPTVRVANLWVAYGVVHLCVDVFLWRLACWAQVPDEVASYVLGVPVTAVDANVFAAVTLQYCDFLRWLPEVASGSLALIGHEGSALSGWLGVGFGVPIGSHVSMDTLGWQSSISVESIAPQRV
jgi:hypothetical protein